MPTTKITSKVLADNAAQENLNAGASITLTKPVSLTSSLTVDASTLYVDPVTHRVGIGTTTPTALLDVNGLMRCNGIVNIGNTQVNGNKQYLIDSRLAVSSPSDGVVLLQNWPLTDFGRVQLGGTTAAFPAIKRNGAGIEIRLADDSAGSTITATNLVYNTGDQNIAGDKTFTDDVAVVGTLTTTDKLTANGQGSFSGLGAKEALVKEHVSDPLFPVNRTALFRELMWSALQARVLNGGSGSSQGASGSSSGAAGYPSAQVGIAYSARAMGGTESGMSRMSGSGANWMIPAAFSVSAGLTMLYRHINGSSSNITAGSNTFTASSNVDSTTVGSTIWSSAFPPRTRITAVNGTTITASANAISTPGSNHQFVVSYEGNVRFWMSSNSTAINTFQKYTPSCTYTYDAASVTAGSNVVQLQSPLLIASTVVVQGQTYVTIPAANSAITVGSTISGTGIPANTYVASVTGNPAVIVNMKDANGNPVAATAGGTINLGIGYSNMVGCYVYGDGIPNGATITAISGINNSNWMNITMSQNATISSQVSGTPVSYTSNLSETYRSNNGFGFEVSPNLTTGKLEFRLICMRAGALTYSDFAPLPTGEITDWGDWYQFVMDYSSTTSQLRLWASQHLADNQTPVRPATPMLTLSVPADMPGRSGCGTQFVVQACANGFSAPANQFVCNITLKDPMYFPDITAAP